MKKKLKKLEKRVDAIAMEVVTLKNKGNDPLANIDFNELSFEEANKQAYESICKHYGITDTEVKGVTFNPKPMLENGWYKFKDSFLYFFNFDKNTFYGFRYNSWEYEDNFDKDFPTDGFENYTKATTEEVEQRLIGEANKRGFNIDCEINCKNGQNFPAIVNEFEYVEEENKLLYSGIEIMRNGAWENCKPYEKPTFKPVFMKCTQEQFDRMRPKLESVGCVFTRMNEFTETCCWLVNDFMEPLRIDVFESKLNLKRREEVHTEAEFLEACGYVEEKIEYTLENIQVDCRGLSEYQINNMCLVFENAGYKKCNLDNFKIEATEEDFVYLRKYKRNNDFALLHSEFTTITYEKFMELFSEKPIEELHVEHKEAKREHKVGDVVKAWDDDKSKFVYGVYNNQDGRIYLVGELGYFNIEIVTEININDFNK